MQKIADEVNAHTANGARIVYQSHGQLVELAPGWGHAVYNLQPCAKFAWDMCLWRDFGACAWADNFCSAHTLKLRAEYKLAGAVYRTTPNNVAPVHMAAELLWKGGVRFNLVKRCITKLRRAGDQGVGGSEQGEGSNKKRRGSQKQRERERQEQEAAQKAAWQRAQRVEQRAARAEARHKT